MTPPEHDVLRIETIPVEACSDGTVVAMVTINRPNKLNALNADVTSAIKEMIAWVESEDLVRCVIMTGAQPLKPVACSCDIRIASSRSKFGTPEINLGLIPGYGGTQRLVSLLGYGKALEMVYTGEMINAEEAFRIGLVNHVVESSELKQKTLDMACLIATKSSSTLRVAKETLRSALDEGLTEGVATEARAFAGLFDTEDKEIGVQAFLNRENAQWKHK